MTHHLHPKRRFTATRTPPRLYALDNDTPLGVTPPSPTCLPDSVLALICPKCLRILYISRGMYSALRSTQATMEPLAPGQISWFNPEHRPCSTIMKKVSLDETIADDMVEPDPSL